MLGALYFVTAKHHPCLSPRVTLMAYPIPIQIIAAIHPLVMLMVDMMGQKVARKRAMAKPAVMACLGMALRKCRRINASIVLKINNPIRPPSARIST